MAETEVSTIRLHRGAHLVEVAPRAGASITRYATESDEGRVDWLRPAAPAAIGSRTPTGMGCFPLVPFSNRVGYARFPFRDRVIELVPNFPPEPHAIHGHGWRAEWAVVARSEHSLSLEYRHAADAWPFPYRARQTFQLGPDALRLRMDVINDAEEAMPVGFGWHPFFVRTPQTRITASVERVWLTGEDALPERQVAVPAEWPLESGLRPDDVVLDNNFTGWDRRVRIEWPRRGAHLEMRASEPLDVLVVYTPAGADYVCAEPASNCIDAFNLADRGRTDTGMLVLAPGTRVTGRVEFRPVLAG